MNCIWPEVLQSGKLEYIPWMEAEKLELQQAVKNAIGMDIYKNSPMVLRVEKQAKGGEIIGYIGNMGPGTGPNLHYGVYDSMKQAWENPLDYIPIVSP